MVLTEVELVETEGGAVPGLVMIFAEAYGCLARFSVVTLAAAAEFEAV